MRVWWILPVALSLASCQADQAAIAKRNVEADAMQDAKCKSWGAKPGTPEYIHCRETLYTQAADDLSRRRQLAAAYLMSHPIGSPPVTTYVPQRMMVNCSSVRTGAFVSANCY